jgi:hypothetical protein
VTENPAIVVFIRATNELDHIAPVIHKMTGQRPDIKFYIYLADYLSEFKGDFRLKHLAARSVVIRHIVDEFRLPAWLRKIYFRMAKSENRYVMNIARRLLLKVFAAKRFEGAWFTNEIFARHPGLVCILHDHNGDAFRAITKKAAEQKIASLALPHAADNFDNFMVGFTETDPYRICPVAKQPYSVSRVIASSRHMRDHLIEHNYAPEENIAVLGSPRFCDEWLAILDEITPEGMKMPETADFKIVFMLPKRTKNAFEDECIRIVQTLSKIKNVQIAVKPHTRNERFTRFSAPNVKFYGKEVTSRALIEWADVTLFSATSVIFDNIKKDKPVLFLRRTINNKIMMEHYIQSWNIDCRDELCRAVFRMQSGEQTRTYSEADRDNLLANLIEPAGKDVLGLYVAEIFKTIEKVSGRALAQSRAA